MILLQVHYYQSCQPQYNSLNHHHQHLAGFFSSQRKPSLHNKTILSWLYEKYDENRLNTNHYITKKMPKIGFGLTDGFFLFLFFGLLVVDSIASVERHLKHKEGQWLSTKQAKQQHEEEKKKERDAAGGQRGKSNTTKK